MSAVRALLARLLPGHGRHQLPPGAVPPPAPARMRPAWGDETMPLPRFTDTDLGRASAFSARHPDVRIVRVDGRYEAWQQDRRVGAGLSLTLLLDLLEAAEDRAGEMMP